ncbi:MAG: hypothetical protein KAU23_08495, partial [Anaerolineales bacterium]|nr:hypothetical protein [Anaerolineales bacterium]
VIEGIDWLNGNSEQDDIVLANEKNGLYIPSMNGRKVIYGHPFETIDAEREKVFVKNFFQGYLSMEMSQVQLEIKGVDYIFYEIDLAQDFAAWMKEMEYPLMFSNDKVEIYRVIRQ